MQRVYLVYVGCAITKSFNPIPRPAQRGPLQRPRECRETHATPARASRDIILLHSVRARVPDINPDVCTCRQNRWATLS